MENRDGTLYQFKRIQELNKSLARNSPFSEKKKIQDVFSS